MAKANADYDKLLRYAKADLEHFRSRYARTEQALLDAIGDHPARAAIMGMVKAHAQNSVDVANATQQVDRYAGLLDKRTSGPADGMGADDTSNETPPVATSDAPTSGRRVK